MTRAHQDLRVEDVTAIVDNKEQLPLDLWLPMIPGSMPTADYTVLGLEALIAVERKSCADMLMCVGRERERFEKCIKRMQSYETRVLVIEASWADIAAGNWRSQLKPTQVKAALYSWMKHVSVVLAGDRATAANVVSGILFSAARNRWRELQGFKDTLKIVGGEK